MQPNDSAAGGATITSRLPRHVAIIMDGNRRWAQQRHLPKIEGHRRGAKTLRTICRAARDLGIEFLTAYAFSRENWMREHSEVNLLLDLCRYFARGELAALRDEGVRVRVLGQVSALPGPTRRALEELVAGTASGRALTLNLAINYSARAEICDAVRHLATEIAAGRLAPTAIDEALVAEHLTTGGMPDPELLIRTGGELRLSNFLLFQAAYTELWSTPICWPDFTVDDFRRALAEYATRSRRFGT